MNTTNIFVELVIIGLGALIWGFLFFALIFNINLLDTSVSTQNNLPSIIISVLFLSFIYLFGILIDRFADLLLTKAGNKLRALSFPNRPDVFKAKIKSYKLDPAFATIFEYSRSRMRICRGWVINSLLILISGNLYIWFSGNAFKISLGALGASPLKISFFLSITFILVLIGSFIFWKNLQKSEYEKLKEVDKLISNKRLEV